ncbi:MAG: 16S rRNA (uracil(1498)-N(3))-methyltransferase [Chryseolinea sp.]
MNLFYQPLIPQGVFYLDQEESKHCIKVLRRSKDDELKITDGKGYFYNAVITKADPQQCQFQIKEKISETVKDFSIHVAISPTKSPERIEWFVEKAVELGIDEISFVHCKTTERPFIKIERLEKVAISAMKQSLKATLPKVNDLIKLDTLIKQANEASKFIAYVDHSNPAHLKRVAAASSNYLVLIGPEGDFSDGELSQAIQQGFKKVSLGNSRLRTETAGLAACHILNLINS